MSPVRPPPRKGRGEGRACQPKSENMTTFLNLSPSVQNIFLIDQILIKTIPFFSRGFVQDPSIKKEIKRENLPTMDV